MDAPKIAILMVNYFGAKDTAECVQSLRESSFQDFAIYVVDNGSDADNVSLLESIEDIHLIKLEDNLGVAAANNVAAAAAIADGAEYLLILNNDTVVDHDMLALLLRDNRRNITVPLMYYYTEPKRLWYAGGKMSKVLGKAKHFHRFVSTNITYATGCCFLLPVEVLTTIGDLADEDYFMYYDDTDFSLRALKAGVSIQLVPEARLWHKIGASSNKASDTQTYYLTRNRLLFLRKHRDYFSALAIPYFYVSRFVIVCMNRLRRCSSKALLEGIHDYRRGVMGIRPAS